MGVHDSATATVLDRANSGINFVLTVLTPELKQDFDNKSKQRLSNINFGEVVVFIFNEADRYGRFVGSIMLNGVDAGLERIEAGLGLLLYEICR